MKRNAIPNDFIGAVKASLRGEEGISYPLAILLDKIRPFFGRRPNKAEKSHLRHLISQAKRDFIKTDMIDMKGILFPRLDPKDEDLLFGTIMWESLYPYLYANDTFDEDTWLHIDHLIYGLTNNTVGVSVQPGDIVIDAGAWIGDFSAYASIKGATTYAFEPTPETFAILTKTAELNANIVPINQGLGDKRDSIALNIDRGGSGGNTFYDDETKDLVGGCEIRVTTVDDFVKDNDIHRVDFIKSDIEGFERHMLAGAKSTLREYAPKLAISTYHLPDDPEVLEQIIVEANPKYRIVHKRDILFADAR